MGGLKVLMTNHTLALRTGTELYVRDLALALLKRGHTPVAYSERVGEVGQELRQATIPVVDDLRNVSSPPDLIHGHHHVETMTALLHFPRVPAVFFCHGWLPFEEIPPRFPRILRYIAVDDTCRDRLLYEHAIPEERVRVILNFVDLQRFPPRAPLPARPLRALVFSNRGSESRYLEMVREACRRAGVELDAIGAGAGNACARPEEVLGQYDLVFAKGRCALEALAVGAAVVLCDAAGVGPMVKRADVERLRRLNFGIRTLRETIHPDVLSGEIARYDAQDAAEVSRQIRATVGIEAATDEIVALYEEVIAEYGEAGEPDFVAEERAAADYLRWLSAHARGELQSMKDSSANSTTAWLRNQVLRVPLLGGLARSVARGVRGAS